MKPRHVLVVTYWSYSDALIQTYTLPYVRILQQALPAGSQISLFTLEQPQAALSAQEQAITKQTLQVERITWLPFRYDRFGVKMLLRMGFLLPYLVFYILRHRIDTIHTWCTPAGGIGYLLSILTGRRLVIDSYEPHAEAMVEAGQWKKTSLAFRLLWWLEKRQSRRASAVIACVAAMQQYAKEKYGIAIRNFYWKPACVDTTLFNTSVQKDPVLMKELGLEGKIVAVYAGKFGGSYLEVEVFHFLKACADYWGDRFSAILLNNHSPAQLQSWLETAGLEANMVIHRFVPHREVPKYMGLGDFGLVPFVPVPSKRYGSPIKTSEYWAMGLPIVISEGISDDSEITQREGFGVVTDWKTDLSDVVARLNSMIRSPSLSTSIISLVSANRSFDMATLPYAKIYGSKTIPIIHYFLHHRPDRSPGQRFRCETYVLYLEEAGFRIQWHNLLDEKEDKVFYSQGNWWQKGLLIFRKHIQRWREVRQVKKGDIVFIYREAFMLWHTWYERKLKRRGARLVFDFDDAIWLRDVSEGNRKVAFLKRPAKTADICRMSDVVIVGNAYLKNYASQYAKRVEVVPTTIDTSYHHPMAPKMPHKGICIGWTGSDTTIRHFEEIVPVLEHIKELYGDRVWFKLISNKVVQYPSLRLDATLWNKEEEVAQLADIDIGIMPLPDDEWSKGKCGFKLLQYMAMGKPVVASPVGVNTDIVQHNHNGYLASTEAEWIAALSALIDDAHLREIMGGRGRQKVVAEYSVDSQRERYVSLFRELVK